MKSLAISEALSIPLDAITQKFAILGTSGSGKSYTAMKLAELMLDYGAQVIAVDPVGIWWSLRLAANGKSEGYKQVVVFGGEHGDLPLTPESGALVARMLAERAIPAVLDVSQFITSEQIRFLAAFGEQFFESKKSHKSPVHLFLEECQTVVPQEPARDENTMLNRWRRLIKFGRNYGVGFSMISQQPQAVDKKVLNEAPTLFAMRTVGSHQRKAILAWVKDVIESESDLVASLPKLPTGTAHLWSPEWLKISQDIKISPKKTFDAGKTPEIGTHAVEPRPLSKIDVEQFKGAMADMIEKAKQDDPVELRKEIRQLKAELAKPNPSRVQRDSTPDPKAIARAVVAVVKPLQEQLRQIKSHVGRAARSLPIVNSAMADLEKCLDEVPAQAEVLPSPASTREPYIRETRIIPASPPQRHTERSDSDDSARSQEPLVAGAVRMLSACATWYPKGITAGQVASQAVIKKRGGSFRTYKSALITRGLIEVKGDLWFATEAGMSKVGSKSESSPQATDEVLNLWLPKLRGKAKDMLRAIVRRKGDSISYEDLAGEVGIEAAGGSFRTYVSSLMTTGLIVKPEPRMVAANTEALFI